MSRAVSRERDEEDVVEIKKALATGNGEDPKAPGASASLFFFSLIDEDHFLTLLCLAVPPILCYCSASILMTVVNKVSPSANIGTPRSHIHHSSWCQATSSI